MLVELVIAVLLAAGSDATCDKSNDDCDIAYKGRWSACDPCTKEKSRAATIVSQPHFDGFPCPENIVEYRHCKTEQKCLNDTQCGDQFNCGYLGRCINPALICNGDDDCGNNADEFNCTAKNITERMATNCLHLKYVPYLDQIGSGIHLGSGKLAGRVVDNHRFQGLCRKAFNGDRDEIYRLPYNIDNFHFQVRTSDDLQVKMYSSMSHYLKELNTDFDISLSLDAELDLSPIEDFIDFGGFKLSAFATVDSTAKSVFDQMKNVDSKLFRVSSEIQLAQFIMKGHDLLLDGYFEQRIRKLPTKMNSKSYFELFKQYGTVYLHSGVLGGRYEHYYIFSSKALKEKKVEEKSLELCIKVHMEASLGLSDLGLGLEGSAKGDFCADNFGKNQSSSDITESAVHKIVNIEGGTTEVAGRLAQASLLANGTAKATTKLAEWVMGVQQNPALIRKTVRPICDLILSSKDPESKEKHKACNDALKYYMQPYSTDQCKSCKKGRPMNIDGKCQCACDENWTGPRCSKLYIPPNQKSRRPTLKSGSYLPQTDSEIKFNKVNGTATNPPYIHWLNIGPYDGILKMRKKHVYILARKSEIYVYPPGGFDEHKIVEYDEMLNYLDSTVINYSTIDNCHRHRGNPRNKSFCKIVDFDIDTDGHFIISVEVGNNINSSICRIDKDTGKALMQIPRPCALKFDKKEPKLPAYVTTTCKDQIVVSCPKFKPATVKIFSLHGRPLQLNQFSGYTQIITGMKHFNKAIWFHTMDNKVVAFDLVTLDEVFTFSAGLSSESVGKPMKYCQVALDFLGNVIIGQAHEHEKGKLNYKFTIVEGSSKKVSAHVKLDRWTNCRDVEAYRGKLFTICGRMEDPSKKAILIFDYLK